MDHGGHTCATRLPLGVNECCQRMWKLSAFPAPQASRYITPLLTSPVPRKGPASTHQLPENADEPVTTMEDKPNNKYCRNLHLLVVWYTAETLLHSILKVMMKSGNICTGARAVNRPRRKHLVFRRQEPVYDDIGVHPFPCKNFIGNFYVEPQEYDLKVLEYLETG